MNMEPILFVVSRGLLEHKPRMGAAVWEYLWFIDKVTKDEPDGNGKFNGLVLGGAPVSAATIANDLHEHLNTAKANIKLLEAEGYIVRQRRPNNRCSYVVTNSKKWLLSRRSFKGDTGTENCASTGTGNCTGPVQKTVPVWTENCTSNKEENRDTTVKQHKRPSPSVSPVPRKTKSPKTRLPDDFGISESVRKWAREKGHARLEERLEHFIGYAKANGAMYVDWDQAFQNAIRGDWAKLNGRPNPNTYHESETRAETKEREKRRVM